MAIMTKQERTVRHQELAASQERISAMERAARRLVATGKCPDCDQALVRNLAIAGCWQCADFGRTCGFRTFTE